MFPTSTDVTVTNGRDGEIFLEVGQGDAVEDEEEEPVGEADDEEELEDESITGVLYCLGLSCIDPSSVPPELG